MLKKLLCLPLLAATFQTTGCGDGNEYEETLYGVWGGGVTSDTTAIILREIVDVYSGKQPFLTGALGYGGRDYVRRELSLNLVDIRFEKIYWKKDITNMFSGYGSINVELIDSVLFLYANKNYGLKEGEYTNINGIGIIATIHMDEKFHQSKKIELRSKDIKLKGEGWESLGNPKARVRPWKDGLILARADGVNSYALLDTAAGTMELWQPSGEFEWLNECADYKWSQTGGLCLNRIPDASGFVLLRNGVDTLAVRRYDAIAYGGWRQMYFNGNSIASDRWIYLIDKQGQVSEKPLDVLGIAISGYFRDLDGNVLADYAKDVKFLD